MKKLIIPVFAFFLGCQSADNGTDAYGNFEAVEIFVSSEGNGQLRQLNITEGQVLQAGVMVGYVDTTTQHLNIKQVKTKRSALQARLNAISANINVLETELKTVLTEVNRIKDLYKNEAATKAQLDNITGRRDVLQSRIKAAETEKQGVYAEMESVAVQLTLLNEQLQNHYIINPKQGTVLEKYAEQGELTTMGKPIYKLADLEALDLRAYITGSQLPTVKVGQEVTVKIDSSENKLISMPGKVIWISSEAEFTPKIIQTKDERVNLVYAMRVRVKNDGRIKIGMPGEVVF